MIEKTVSHYHILEKLGEGGMGVVYKARDVKLERHVALKFLPSTLSDDEQEKARFIQEAKAASALDHPNICTIYEIDETEDDELFIAMACYDGETLDRTLRNGPLDLATAVRIGLQIAQGLARAHEHGILHRDIKPANIIVTERGEPKILDFGLAKLVGQTRLTRAGETLGTAAYMSPEQIQGKDVDHRSDIFSLGILIYEGLTGKNPFAGDYAQAVMYAILHDQPEPVSSLVEGAPKELDAILTRMLAKLPDERYTSTADLVGDLQSVLRQIESGKQSRILHARNGAHVTPAEPTTNRKQKPPANFPEVKPVNWAIAAMLVLVVLILAIPATRNTLFGWLGFEVTPKAKHIAVLPFENISDQPAHQALCDGLAETLTSKLSQLEQFQGSLWVVPSSEVRRSKIFSPSEAQKQFGANLVITGSVQRFSNLLRLTINLIDVTTMRQLASKIIDDPMTSVSVLQDDAVVILAQMLNVELQPESTRLLRAGATTVPGAYEFYLRGRGMLQRYDKVENIDQAITLFRRALENDTDYARAYAALGDAYLRKFQATKEVNLVDLAEQHCERALQIDDLLPDAHVTLGMLYTETGRVQQALETFQQALELDARNPDAYRGRARAFKALGQLEEAEAIYKKAISIKPDYWGGYNDLGVFYFSNGRYEDAITQFQHVIELTPQNAKGYRNLGAMYFSLNRIERAVEYYRKSLQIQPSYSTYSNLATLYFNQARYQEAAEMYEKALEIQDTDHRVWGYLASAYMEIPGAEQRAKQATRRAIAAAEELLKINPRDPEVLMTLAGTYIDIGEIERGKSYLEKVVMLDPKDLSIIWQIGYTYELLGMRDKALNWIGRALKSGYDVSQTQNNPKLAELRQDPRYKALIKK